MEDLRISESNEIDPIVAKRLMAMANKRGSGKNLRRSGICITQQEIIGDKKSIDNFT